MLPALALAFAVAASQPAPLPPNLAPPAGRVPLLENFSRGEIATIAGAAVVDLTLVLLQTPIADARGEPLIGDPPGFDEDISDALYRGPGAGHWLGRVPDYFGIAGAPVLTLGFYGVDALGLALRGRSFTGDPNADHEFFALLEAYVITLGITQVAKVGIGRERPYLGLDRPDKPEITTDSELSFFSGHSSSSFCLAAFVSRDVGDWLVSSPLRESSPAARVLVGRVLPSVVFYGVAGWVALSRVIDQYHYFSDVLVGSVVGATVGNIVYAVHFDGDGRPRARGPAGPEVHVVALPAGLGVAGSF